MRPGKIDEDDLRTFEWYYLWRLCQGGLRHRFPVVNFDNNKVLALSPDGLTLASGFDNTIKLWDTLTGREKGALTGHRNMVRGLVFTADGKKLVSTDTLTVRLWDLATGKEQTVLTPPPNSSGYPIAVAGDGNTLFLNGVKVTQWDLTTGRQVGVVGSGGTAWPPPLAVAANGQTVAARRNNGIVGVWGRDGDAWRERPTIPAGNWHRSLALSPDGTMLAVDGKCYDPATGQLRLTLSGHTGDVLSVDFSADGKALVSAGHDQTARVWDAATGRQLACFAHPVAVHGAVLSADGKVLATAGDGIRVWDAAPPEEAVILRHTAAVASVALSRDGKTLCRRRDGMARRCGAYRNARWSRASRGRGVWQSLPTGRRWRPFGGSASRPTTGRLRRPASIAPSSCGTSPPGRNAVPSRGTRDWSRLWSSRWTGTP